jgi:GntR family transcriptional regulator, carbon starvation induced regulator
MAATLPPAPETRADWVDRRLKEAILRGELGPGERLVAATLAERWNVSATPLREAIQRLAAEGLVQTAPQRGARVAPVSARDAEEIYELRLLLEPRALRESLAHSDEAHRGEIDAAYVEFERTVAAADLAGALDAHRDLHAALLARCPSRWLLRLIGLLAEQSQLFQLTSIGAPGGHYDVIGEHRSIVDDACAGRVDEAVAALTEHLQRTLDGVRTAARADRE